MLLLAKFSVENTGTAATCVWYTVNETYLFGCVVVCTFKATYGAAASLEE